MAVRTHPTHGSVILTFGELIQDVVAVPVADLAYGGGHVDGEISYFRGGCGANVAAGCAQVGVPTRFLGHAGADPTGDKLISQLSGAGVDVVTIRRGETASSLTIYEPGGDAMLVFHPGGSRNMGMEDIRNEHFTGIAIVHANSHHLYAPETRAAFGQVIGLAHAADVFLSIDVSASNRLITYGVDNYRDDLKVMHPDVLLANEKEAEILGVFDHLPEGVGMVVVHRGDKPTVALGSDGSERIVEVAPVPEVVDTIGGGDAFAAGYLSALLNHAQVEDAIEAGHRLAAEIVRQPGVEFPIERNPEIRRVAG